jgi:hypothetical protein
MPTEYGGETIDERLTRLRTTLTRVRGTIARHENNGAAWTTGGTTVTEISYERARDRERELMRDIRVLEARLGGKCQSQAVRAQTRMD